MKTKHCLAIILALCSCLAYGQDDKRTQAVEALYKENKFQEVIDYQKHRTKKLPAKVLYYKGMAHLNQDDLQTALNMFDKAIEIGPADIQMYYQKCIIHIENKQYKQALGAINEAILLETDHPDLYMTKGEIYYYKEVVDSAQIYLHKATTLQGFSPKAILLIAEIKKEKHDFTGAFDEYQKAFAMLVPNKEYHNYCSFNMAQMQQELMNFKTSKELFKKHIEHYPDDYRAVMKIIQLNTALNLFQENPMLRNLMYEAASNNQLPKKMNKSFCYEIFEWNKNLVYGLDFFNPSDDKANFAKYKYLVYNQKDELIFRIHLELDSTKKDSVLNFKLIRNDSCFSYNLKCNYSPDFKKLSSTIKEILAQGHAPVDTLAAYGKWTDKIKSQRNNLATLERDGSSFAKAIIAQSIPKEYEWIREYYPGAAVKMQSLVFNDGKPYDILHIETIDGVKKQIYFDISSFFGKGF
jgi:tetratricopeptide (TPR) repeat protein